MTGIDAVVCTFSAQEAARRLLGEISCHVFPVLRGTSLGTAYSLQTFMFSSFVIVN